jgi:hypothetical protein
LTLRQAFSHHWRVTLSTVGQWPLLVRQGNVIPTRFGMTNKEERSFHLTLSDGILPRPAYE